MRSESPFTLVKATRELQGITQTELAKRSGVSRPMIQLIEAGLANPSLGILEKLSSVLKLQVEMKTRFSARAALGVFFGVLTSNRPTRPRVRRMSRAQLREWIILSCNENSTSDRVQDGWDALCLALREYYPTFFKSFENFPAGRQIPTDGRMIKLKRLILPMLVKVMNE